MEFIEIYLNKSNNKKQCHKRKIKIFRNYTEKDKDEYIRQNPEKICEICKSIENIQVDHYPVPFSKLLDSFINEENIDYWHINIFRSIKKIERCYKWILKFNDEEILPKWIKYHNKNHSYRYLCNSCNSKNKSYGYRHNKCTIFKGDFKPILKKNSSLVQKRVLYI